MTRAHSVALLVCSLLLGGCGFGLGASSPEPPAIETRFRPRSAIRTERTTTAAIEFYQDDIKRLDPLVTIVGRLWVRGPDKSTADAMSALCSSEAAKVGGTHMLLVAEGEDVQRNEVVDEERTNRLAVAEALQAMGDSMQCAGKDVCIQQRRPARGPAMKTVVTRRPERVYLIVAVDPDDWEKLPDALRPKALERPAQPKK